MAKDSVGQARETLQRLRARLHSEPEESETSYVEALDSATNVTDQLLELLASREEESRAESKSSGDTT
jgi:hypothetical protein